MNIIRSYLAHNLFVPVSFYGALEFIDKEIAHCNLYSYADEHGIHYCCDAGSIVGTGSSRLFAVEDVLRQYLAKIKHY